MFKQQHSNQKRLLALDGGGILGITSLMILKKIEDDIKTQLNETDEFRLSHFFDYIAGTSTGAIIAAGLAMGMSVDDLIKLYTDHGKNMFTRARIWQWLRFKYNEKYLSGMLKEKLTEQTIEELNNNSSPDGKKLQSILMIVARNINTESSWPVSTNSSAKYYDDNKIIKLWQLVRASTAAPTYFRPEKIKVDQDNTFLFEDGGVTAYNNPAFLLYRMATLPQYRIGWNNQEEEVTDPWSQGEDKMMLVSVGVGQPFESKVKRSTRGNLLWKVASEIPSDLMQGVNTENDVNCRTIGRCVYGAPIDSELGDLIPKDKHGAKIPLSKNLGKHFLYARYEADISQKNLEDLQLAHVNHKKLGIDKVDKIPELLEIGQAVANKINFKEDFSTFLH